MINVALVVMFGIHCVDHAGGYMSRNMFPMGEDVVWC